MGRHTAPAGPPPARTPELRSSGGRHGGRHRAAEPLPGVLLGFADGSEAPVDDPRLLGEVDRLVRGLTGYPQPGLAPA